MTFLIGGEEPVARVTVDLAITGLMGLVFLIAVVVKFRQEFEEHILAKKCRAVLFAWSTVRSRLTTTQALLNCWRISASISWLMFLLPSQTIAITFSLGPEPI